ncbi:hypothetical protein [Staphylococcus aureus]
MPTTFGGEPKNFHFGTKNYLTLPYHTYLYFV